MKSDLIRYLFGFFWAVIGLISNINISEQPQYFKYDRKYLYCAVTSISLELKLAESNNNPPELQLPRF